MLPIFFTKDFSQDIIFKLQQLEINLKEAANIRLICNTTPPDNMEDKVKQLLLMVSDDTQPTLKPIALLLKSPSKYLSHRTSTGSYWESAKRVACANPPVEPQQIIDYWFHRDQHLQIQILHIINDHAPMYTQEWINLLCHQMVA